MIFKTKVVEPHKFKWYKDIQLLLETEMNRAKADSLIIKF